MTRERRLDPESVFLVFHFPFHFDMAFSRVGILGGTFDPIHHGHLRPTVELARRFGFDLTLFVPAHCPPHKRAEHISPAFHRYAMAVLATLDLDGVEVSTLEVFASRRVYTVETLAALRKRFGSATRLFFMMGTDQFLTFPTWRDPRGILDLASVVVMARPGQDNEGLLCVAAEFGPQATADLRDTDPTPETITELLGAGTRIFLTDEVLSNLSATQIRTLAREGRDISEFVPPSVERYITKYRLYGNPDEPDGRCRPR